MVQNFYQTYYMDENTAKTITKTEAQLAEMQGYSPTETKSGWYVWEMQESEFYKNLTNHPKWEMPEDGLPHRCEVVNEIGPFDTEDEAVMQGWTNSYYEIKLSDD